MRVCIAWKGRLQIDLYTLSGATLNPSLLNHSFSNGCANFGVKKLKARVKVKVNGPSIYQPRTDIVFFCFNGVLSAFFYAVSLYRATRRTVRKPYINYYAFIATG